MTASPIIITGMHRSGTSLLASMLQKAGLYLGKRIDRHLESRFHSRVNKRILSDLACNWANPSGIAESLLQSQNRDSALRFTRACLSTWTYRSYAQPVDTQQQWGWKDPKTTLTLPVWISHYPNARVVHIKRHGMDVALSLQRRAEHRRVSRRLHDRPRRAYLFAGMAHSELYDGRFTSLMNGLTLWHDYQTAFADYQRAGLAGNQVIELEYESLLGQPTETIRGLLDQLGLSAKAVNDLDTVVKSDRAMGWKRSDDARLKVLLTEHRDTVTRMLSSQGYSLDPD